MNRRNGMTLWLLRRIRVNRHTAEPAIGLAAWYTLVWLVYR